MSCETSSRVVAIPIVVEPVVVELPLPVVPVEATNVEVAVSVAVHARDRLCHHPSKPRGDLRVVSYSAS